jgi:hypothetical protein
MDSTHGLSLQTIGGQWKQRQTPAPARFRQLTGIAPKRHVINVAVNANSVAYVTDNGRCYMLGRHAMHAQPDTGLVSRQGTTHQLLSP